MIESVLQPTHLLLLLGVVLLVLGPKRLPEAGRGLGQGLREFKQSLTAASEHRTTEETKVSDSIS
jgi:sec-independent protein translocase protein TatA